ncbi:MAG: HEAT repeat domain-containing protein [Hyphomicrobiales bacterium]|nr:HEAT repeat domain-containing protein [Hyphomicrobiales bacterium]MCP5371893.1 HEAT repeat domain-containing protein [Hyphomicrobiales bacterium]
MQRHLHLLVAVLVALSLAAGWAPARAAADDPATTPAKATVDSLLLAILDADDNTRLDAIAALGRSGDPRALAPLTAIMDSRGRPGQDRMTAAAALGDLGDRRAVEPLIAALRDDMTRRTGIMMAIIPSLGVLGDRRAVPILLDALTRRQDDWLAREAAARALGMIGDRRAVPHLLNAAWMADTRGDAVIALARMADPRALEVFLSALQFDEEPDVRDAAARGLVDLGPVAVPPLVDIAARSGGEGYDRGLRLRAIEVLGTIGGADARRTLEQAARDPDPTVALAARTALRRAAGD